MWVEGDLICPPTLAPYAWPCPWPLSLEALNQAAHHILGTHDFTTFAAVDPDLSTRADPEPAPAPIRTISYSAWHAADGLLLYRVTANGFLHHMVRNLVGTFVQAGAYRLSPDSIPTLLAAHNRAAAGPTAPPQGLFLVSVEYPDLEPRTSNLET
jgi:tRNA pseudouridine38-40 synthase